MKIDLFIDTLPKTTLGLLDLIKKRKPQFLNDFYLTGGTALSLLLGHRESEDLDWFNQENFDPLKLQGELTKLGRLTRAELEENTLNAYINGTKVQFLGYPYRLLEPLIIWEQIPISSLLDIACTKLQTIGVRGSKKDFIDLFSLLEHFTLEDLFTALKRKYRGVDYNQQHLLKSLVYFVNADSQPMPRLHREVSWEAIKEELVRKIKSINL